MSIRKMSNKRYGQIIIISLLFVICPFMAFLVSLRNPLKRFNQIIIIFYFGLLGLVRKLDIAGDAATWTKQIIDYSLFGEKEVISRIVGYAGHNAAYQWFLFLLSKIHYTSIIWCILFMITTTIHIYIYNLQFAKNLPKTQRLSLNNIILFILFIGCIPFTSWGVKFWIAVDIFLVGYYLCINRENKIGLLFIITSVIFHYTLSFIVFIFLLYYINNKRSLVQKTILYCLFALLLYLSYDFFLNSFVESKYELYSENSFIGQRALWVRFNRTFMTIFSVIACVYIYHIGKKEKKDMIIVTLRFLLLFALCLIPLIPTADGFDRFSRVFSFMFLIALIRFSFCHINIKKVFLISYFIFGLNLLFNILLNRGELDAHVFYENIFYYFSHNLMTVFIH